MVSAEREVILCAGSLQSPQLLKISGIGDAELLRNYGIPVIVDLPGVGKNPARPLHFISQLQGCRRPGSRGYPAGSPNDAISDGDIPENADGSFGWYVHEYCESTLYRRARTSINENPCIFLLILIFRYKTCSDPSYVGEEDSFHPRFREQ